MITIDGLVEKPITITMDQLEAMESINIAVTLNCDGNRRKEVNTIEHSKGFNWVRYLLFILYIFHFN